MAEAATMKIPAPGPFRGTVAAYTVIAEAGRVHVVYDESHCREGSERGHYPSDMTVHSADALANLIHSAVAVAREQRAEIAAHDGTIGPSAGP